MVKAAVVATLGEWGSSPDMLERSWIAHGAAVIATLGGDLYETRHTTPSALVRALSSYDLIGISANSATYYIARQVLELIRGLTAKKAVGGVHASIQSHDYDGLADYIIQGHGERAWQTLLLGGTLPSISRHDVDSLDDLPFIDRSKWRPETCWLDLPAPFATVVTARGCPYLCSYCWPAEQVHFGKNIKRRSVGHLVAELKQIQQTMGIRSVQIHDDTFTYDYKWVEEFIEKAGSLGLKFFIGTRADHVCRWPEMFRSLKSVGVEVVSVGFESGNQQVLDIMRKGVTVEENTRAGRILHEIGFRIFANYMFGLPDETPDQMQDTVKMIRLIKPEYHSVSIFSPYPGSALGEKVRQEGRVATTVYRRDPSRAYLREHDLDLIHRMMAEAQHS